MNYYNPYYSMYPYAMSAATKPGLFSGLINGFKGINFSSILSGTQKTLGIVNQTIPLVKQASPIIRNAKTMFKVMNEFKKMDPPKNNSRSNDTKKPEIKEEAKEYMDNTNLSDGPTFFL